MRKIAWITLLIFGFSVPWEYSLDLGAPLGNIARIAGLGLLAAAVPAVLLAGRARVPGAVQWLVLALLVWLCCSYFWSIDPPGTLTRIRGYFQEMMIVWLVWELAEDATDLRNLMRAYIAGSWVLALLTIANFAGPETVGQVRFVAAGQDPNDAARFLDLGFPMAALLYKSESGWAGKLTAIGYLPLGLASVLLTASRSGFVAATLALGGCGILLVGAQPRKAAGLAVAILVLMGVIWMAAPPQTTARIATIPEQLAGGDLNQRLNIWAAGWQSFVQSPFLGSGAGSFVSAARLAPEDTAHNTALSIAVEGGVVALALALSVAVACACSVFATRGAIRIALGTVFLVWLVASIAATVEENRATWYLLAMISLAGRLEADAPGDISRCFDPRGLASRIPASEPAG